VNPTTIHLVKTMENLDGIHVGMIGITTLSVALLSLIEAEATDP
jgi:hypothetical protein